MNIATGGCRSDFVRTICRDTWDVKGHRFGFAAANKAFSKHVHLRQNRYKSGGREATVDYLKKLSCKAFGRPLKDVEDQTLGSKADTAAELKAELTNLLEETNRGIFGVQTEKKRKIHETIEKLEALNPNPVPMHCDSCVAGEWRVLYSTIKITGSKRTKLGLREFVKIDDMLQEIEPHQNLAINRVRFSVMGLGSLSGELRIVARYAAATDSRVNIEFVESTLAPEQLQKLFEKNYDLLLGIFNPEGWLDITYVDDTHRVGRDDKGNVFVLQRT